MKKLFLNGGQFALVDDRDFEELSLYKWNAHWDPKENKFRARRSEILKKIYLSRHILNVADPKIKIDHIDGNPLNNQRNNLRVSTHIQNSRNVNKRLNCSSIYKGVSWYKRDSKWKVGITVNYKSIHLGYFYDEIIAAKVYDEAAIKYFGEFSKTNFLRASNG